MRFLCFSVALFFSSVTALQTFSNVQNSKKIGGQFDDILLAIHYNHPHYNSIPFLQQLYSPFFPNIVFFGGSSVTHPKIFQIPNTRGGYFISEGVAQVIETFKNYKGYLFVQDDCLLNIWNLLTLDPEKIWFAIAQWTPDRSIPASWSVSFDRSNAIGEFEATIDPVNYIYHENHPRVGPLRQAVSSLTDEERRKFMDHCEEKIILQLCEVFYVPNRFALDIIHPLLAFKDIFCEFAIPTVLACVDDIKNWEYLKGQNQGGLFRSDCSWFHSLKFSSLENQKFALDVFDRYASK